MEIQQTYTFILVFILGALAGTFIMSCCKMSAVAEYQEEILRLRNKISRKSR